ncbi:MAG: indole-3-glycerol phosphate synthase TrpC [Enterocloster asparagiformis]|nr:indole-3-glycerol phosphate synthase TrpC [Enterocloster asparagiformis]
MILEQIAASTRKRVEQEKMERPPEQVKRQALDAVKRERETAEREQAAEGEAAAPGAGRRLPGAGLNPFEAALRKPGMSFICEVKKASPSKGVIAEEFHYKEIAAEYERAGADAVSVLTEPEYFQGCSMYLEEIHRQVKLPLLRKDFVVDEYQIYDAKLLGASAVLLICSLLKGDKLKRFHSLCGELGLAALVEAHDDEEVSMAAEAGARIIGINNRNLKTFEVDFSNALRLRRLVPRETVFVAESGIRTAEDIRRLAEARVDAVLIGETLMRAGDKAAMLKELRRGSVL